MPFSLLGASENQGAWLTATDLVEMYCTEAETSRPLVIDLSGGQPELFPEWVPWMMDALRSRELEGRVYLWSDDNLSTDYYWRYLTDDERSNVASFRGYGRVACFKGFDAESFAFNTEADPMLFDRQFELFDRYLDSGLDMFAYATLTTPQRSAVRDGVARFVDRLQGIDEYLPLRTVPLRVGLFGVVEKRLLATADGDLRRQANTNQLAAVEVWNRELEDRFPSSLRSKPIGEIALRRSRRQTVANR